MVRVHPPVPFKKSNFLILEEREFDFMQCEYCLAEHDGSFATGRFCNRKCSNGFSTKAKRKEINEKVSGRMSGKKPSSKDYDNLLVSRARITEEYYEKLLKLDFKDVPRNAIRIVVLLEQDFSCHHCTLKEWYGEPIVLELDHEDGNKNNNSRENLRALCPNCHSLTPTWRGKKGRIKSKRQLQVDKIRKSLLSRM